MKIVVKDGISVLVLDVSWTSFEQQLAAFHGVLRIDKKKYNLLSTLLHVSEEPDVTGADVTIMKIGTARIF